MENRRHLYWVVGCCETERMDVLILRACIPIHSPFSFNFFFECTWSTCQRLPIFRKHGASPSLDSNRNWVKYGGHWARNREAVQNRSFTSSDATQHKHKEHYSYQAASSWVSTPDHDRGLRSTLPGVVDSLVGAHNLQSFVQS